MPVYGLFERVQLSQGFDYLLITAATFFISEGWEGLEEELFC